MGHPRAKFLDLVFSNFMLSVCLCTCVGRRYVEIISLVQKVNGTQYLVRHRATPTTLERVTGKKLNPVDAIAV